MNQLQNLEAVVFAAGEGKRMESEIPKVLHPINGVPMILITLKKLVDLGIKNIVVVVGYKAEEVIEVINNWIESQKLDSGGPARPTGGADLPRMTVKFSTQEEQLGTANALKVALKTISPDTENILVLNGDDSAFYSLETLKEFIESHPRGGISAMTVTKPKADNIGRVIRDGDRNFEKILELNEYQESGLSSDEVNCGVYIFNRHWVERNIDKVPVSSSGEFYITELLSIAKNEGVEINLYQLKNPNEWHGINTKEDLERANTM